MCIRDSQLAKRQTRNRSAYLRRSWSMLQRRQLPIRASDRFRFSRDMWMFKLSRQVRGQKSVSQFSCCPPRCPSCFVAAIVRELESNRQKQCRSSDIQKRRRPGSPECPCCPANSNVCRSSNANSPVCCSVESANCEAATVRLRHLSSKT